MLLTIEQPMDKEANWLPLKRYYGKAALNYYMYMGDILSQQNTKIYRYKHKFTRNYLNIDRAGNLYRFSNGQYEPLEKGKNELI